MAKNIALKDGIIKNSGFTLMELVVAMVLVAMVTLIAALGFRLSVRTWERGKTEGNSPQIFTAIPSLLQKQLDSVETLADFDDGKDKTLLFSGSARGISFFTSYAPRGSSIQGLIRVTYIFNKEKKRLAVFEKSITQLKDIDEENNPLSDKWNNELEPVSIIDNIENFSVFFVKKINNDNQNNYDEFFDNMEWKTSWDKNEHGLPVFIKLILEQGSKHVTQQWYFEVGFG